MNPEAVITPPLRLENFAFPSEARNQIFFVFLLTSVLRRSLQGSYEVKLNLQESGLAFLLKTAQYKLVQWKRLS